MITDRTLSDVGHAALLRKKIQSGQTLTDAEQALFERGSCTIAMLNRIESKQAELAAMLNGYSYMVSIKNKHWAYSDIFTNVDYRRLLDNLDKLIKAFYAFSDTPAVPSYLYGYQEANDAEKILVDLETMIGSMTENFRQCGTFQCGEDNND